MVKKFLNLTTDVIPFQTIILMCLVFIIKFLLFSFYYLLLKVFIISQHIFN